MEAWIARFVVRWSRPTLAGAITTPACSPHSNGMAEASRCGSRELERVRLLE
jgi:hypothetical protein